jgi:hypothetical protein
MRRENEQLAKSELMGQFTYCGSQIGFGLRFGSIEKRLAFERYHSKSFRAESRRGKPAC